jgi:ribosome-associated protein
MIPVTDRLAIDQDEIEETFVRASGPADGNVKGRYRGAASLRRCALVEPRPSDARARLRQHAGRRMTADGVVVIMARRFRTQERNRQDAYEAGRSDRSGGRGPETAHCDAANRRITCAAPRNQTRSRPNQASAPRPVDPGNNEHTFDLIAPRASGQTESATRVG